jgi:hypothetical protein
VPDGIPIQLLFCWYCISQTLAKGFAACLLASAADWTSEGEYSLAADASVWQTPGCVYTIASTATMAILVMS